MNETPTPLEGNSGPSPALQVAKLLASVDPAIEACEETIRAALQRFYNETGFEPVSLYIYRGRQNSTRAILVGKVELTIATDPR